MVRVPVLSTVAISHGNTDQKSQLQEVAGKLRKCHEKNMRTVGIVESCF